MYASYLLNLTFLARCLKSSVLLMRPSLQSGFRYGFRHWTMNWDIWVSHMQTKEKKRVEYVKSNKLLYGKGIQIHIGQVVEIWEIETLLLQTLLTKTHLFTKSLFTFFSQFTGSVCFSCLCGKLQWHNRRDGLRYDLKVWLQTNICFTFNPRLYKWP